MVKTQLEREQLQCNVISLNTQLTNWLDTMEKQTKSIKKSIADEEFIDIDGYSEDELNKNQSKQKKFAQMSNGAVLHPISDALRTETMWINEICRRLQINLQPESLIEGELVQGFLLNPIGFVLLLFFFCIFPDFPTLNSK